VLASRKELYWSLVDTSSDDFIYQSPLYVLGQSSHVALDAVVLWRPGTKIRMKSGVRERVQLVFDFLRRAFPKP